MSKDYQKKRSEQLGMAISTARSMLFKLIIFDLAKQCKQLLCFRCQQEIQSIDDFSIDHKQDWMYKPDPQELFFSLNNVAFSHIACNSASTRCNFSSRSQSGFKGVTKSNSKNRKKKYRAVIQGKNIGHKDLGYFETPQEAAMAYDEAALKMFKEKAVTNKMLGLI